MPDEIKTEDEKQKEWNEVVVEGDGDVAEPEKKPEVEPPGEPIEETPPTNESAEQPPPAELPPAEPQYKEIVHNGQVHRITEEKYLELAQKGFDYDYKVGPHSRIAKIITQYPDIAELVDKQVRAKLEGRETVEEKKSNDFGIKPLSNYETADDWLKDNIVEVTKMMQAQAAPRQQSQREVNEQIVTMLKMHDPQDFSAVFPLMRAEIPNLTISEYQRVDSDIGELLKFYDAVKMRAKQKRPANAPVQQPVNKPPFRVASGKLPPVDTKSSADKIWDLPNSKFSELINKARGFA